MARRNRARNLGLLLTKYLLTVCLFAVSLNAMGFGIGDWRHETPGGNCMSDPGSGTQLAMQKTGDELFGIERWYFYKNFIVGELGDKFFIVDEKSGEKFVFENEDKWVKGIQSRGLEPVFWTRWYRDNWVDGDWMLVWVFFGFFFTIPLTMLFMFALYQVVVKERFRLTSAYTIFVLFSVVAIGLTLLLDHYPSSI